LLTETPTLPIDPTDARDDARDDEQLLAALATALHEFGAPSYDLENFILAYAQKLGLQVEVFCSPTSIFLSFDYGDHSKTTMARMRPGEINLGKLAEVYSLLGSLSESQTANEAPLKRSEVWRQLASLRRQQQTSKLAMVLSFAVASGTAAGFFGGGYREAIVATAVGLAIGLVGLMVGSRPRVRQLSQPICAIVAALLAACGGTLLSPVSIEIVTLSSLIVLIPGLSITTAISELAQEHLTAGTSRLTGALVQLLSIGFGVAVGRAIAGQFLPLLANQAEAMPPIGLLACLAVAPLSFTVLFRAHWRDTPWIMLTCSLAFGSSMWGQSLFGAELGAAFGAFALALTSNLLSRLSDKPAQVFLVPALLILVPGSVGFNAVQAFVDHQTVQAMQSAFSALFVAVALVAGLLVANVLVRPTTIR